MDVERDGRIARFYGEHGSGSFLVDPKTMRWLSPAEEEPITQEILEDWVDAIKKYYKKEKFRVFFTSYY